MELIQLTPHSEAGSSMGKRILSYWKPMFTASAVLAFVSGLQLLVYLKRIDRIDLLQGAMASKEGLILIFVMAIFLSALLFVLWFGGSYFGFVATQMYKDHKDVPPNMERLLWGMSAAWCVLMFSIFQSETTYTGLALGLYLLVATIVGVGIQVRVESCLCGMATGLSYGAKLKAYLCAFSRGGIVGAVIGASVIFTFFAAWIFVTLNPDVGHQKPSSLLSLELVSAAAPGLLVNIFFFRSYTRTGDVKRSGRESTVAALVIAFYLCSVVPQLTIYPVNMRALAAAGLYSTDEKIFAAGDPRLLSVLGAAGFALDATYPEAKIFRAYERFHFGDKLVLCVVPYDPLVNAKPVVGRPTQGLKGQLANRGCVDTKEGEVRRISLATVEEQLPSHKSPL